MSELTESDADRRRADPDPRRDAIDRWSEALARGDDAEANRLVRQSRLDRVGFAASEPRVAMVGLTGPSPSSEPTAGTRPTPLGVAPL